MINDLLLAIEKELGQPLPGTSRVNVRASLAEKWGGQRVYVPAMPKEQAKARLVRVGTAMPVAVQARALGLHQRQVIKVRRMVKV